MTTANEPSVAELANELRSRHNRREELRDLLCHRAASELERLERRCAEMEKELAARQPLPASWCKCLGWCYFNEGHHANCTCKAERHGIGPMYQPPERANDGKKQLTCSGGCGRSYTVDVDTTSVLCSLCSTAQIERPTPKESETP